jgi:hypothetical protein
MNKTMKVALCIGLAGLGVFVWAHSATAGKPIPPPVTVTFLSGDVSAAPQLLGGPFTATIDFAKHLAYPVGSDSIADWKDLINFMQAKNPITYDSLSITVSKKGAAYCGLYFSVKIDDVLYDVVMNGFTSSDPTESTPTLDTFHWHDGRFAIMRNGRLAVVAGCYGGRPNVDFSMSK